MTDWTAGYVTDIGYTHGFYTELVPTRLGFAALARGVAAPAQQGEPLTICELGCGQGFSANIIAAANAQIQVYATDFNPAQIAGAKALAAEAGTPNIRFFDASFAEFLTEPALPAQFDIISLHGIYSWISPANRQEIVRFIRAKLRPGGLVYISYNTLPGWAAAMPLRRLMVDHAALSAGPIAPRIEAAIAFVEQMRAANAGYFAQNPATAARFDKLKGMSRKYLAHEYFNRDWTPFYMGDVAAELAEAKLSFVGSAHLLDHIDAINLSTEQQALLNSVADPVRREGLRDFCVNQQFRRDVFARGAVALALPESRERWLETRFVLSALRADIPMTVAGALGSANLQPEVYAPLLDGLARGPQTLRQLLADKTIADLGWQKLMQALVILVGAGHAYPCLPARGEPERQKRTRAFNAAVMKRAEFSADLAFLASPVTGAGHGLDRISQLFLAHEGQKGVDAPDRVWQTLAAQGQRLIKEGATLETAEDNLAELRTRHGEFVSKRLPVLKTLGIA